MTAVMLIMNALTFALVEVISLMKGGIIVIRAVMGLMNPLILVIDADIPVMAAVKRLSSEAASAIAPLIPSVLARKRRMPRPIVRLAGRTSSTTLSVVESCCRVESAMRLLSQGLVVQ
jgi:hypothetical protein